MVSEDSYNNGPKIKEKGTKKITSIDLNKVFLRLEKYP